jgi:hypothetical protein
VPTRIGRQSTDRLPGGQPGAAEEILVCAAKAAMGLRDLAALTAEIYERSRPGLPDQDPARAFGDRAVRSRTASGTRWTAAAAALHSPVRGPGLTGPAATAPASAGHRHGGSALGSRRAADLVVPSVRGQHLVAQL